MIGRTCAVSLVVYVVAVTIILAITLPVLSFQQDAARDSALAEASQEASLVTLHVSTQLAALAEASQIALGFVLAGAPLSTPSYSGNLSARLAAATTPGANPNALSRSGYWRLRNNTRTAYPDLVDVSIWPGGVQLYSAGEPVDLFERDKLATRAALVLAAAVVEGPFTRALVTVLSPVFAAPTRPTALQQDAFTNWSIVDNATLPNINALWGFISVTGNVSSMLASVTSVKSVHKCVFVKAAAAPIGVSHFAATDVVLYASSLPEGYEVDDATGAMTAAGTDKPLVVSSIDAAGHVAAEECVSHSTLFGGWVCSRVWLSKPSDAAAVGLGGAAALCLVVPALLVAVAAGILHCLFSVAPDTDPFLHLPHEAPFFAGIVDLCDAAKLWSEIPYAAAAAVRALKDKADLLASPCHVYIAQNTGSTIVVVSRSPRGVVRFCRRLQRWVDEEDAGLPPELVGQFPESRVSLTAIVHHCKVATISVLSESPEDASTNLHQHRANGATARIFCEDFWLMQAMRPAAVPNSIVATAQFLVAAALLHGGSVGKPAADGMPPQLVQPAVSDLSMTLSASSNEMINTAPATAASASKASKRRGVGASGAGANDGANELDSASHHALLMAAAELPYIAGRMKRLGECRVQTRIDSPLVTVEGYLLAVEANDDIDHLYETMPDRIMLEWRLIDPDDGPPSSTQSQTRPASRQSDSVVSSPTMNPTPPSTVGNGGVDLPGSAVDAQELRKLALWLAERSPAVAHSGHSQLGASRRWSASQRRASMSTEMVKIQPVLSLASHFLSALRVLFAPLDPESRSVVVLKICAATGVSPGDDGCVPLAARCSEMCYESYASTVQVSFQGANRSASMTPVQQPQLGSAAYSEGDDEPFEHAPANPFRSIE